MRHPEQLNKVILAVPSSLRNELQQKNLHDTEEPPLQKQATPDPNPKLREERSIDGSHNGMASILTRHYPELADSLKGIVNPFAPWRTA